MTQLVEMIDSIESPKTTGTPIPKAIMDAQAVAGYVAGNSWPSFFPYAAARPDLARRGRVISITLTWNAHAIAYDIEAGGGSNENAGKFLALNAPHLRVKPWLYTFAGNASALISSAHAQGWPRDRYYLWLAHWGRGRHICGPATCGFPAADGTQYTDQVPGNCDASVMSAYMFPGFAPPPPKPPEGRKIMGIATNGQDWPNTEVFVETQPAGPGKSGEVFHIRNDAQSQLHWWQKKDGSPNWLSLGSPKA